MNWLKIAMFNSGLWVKVDPEIDLNYLLNKHLYLTLVLPDDSKMCVRGCVIADPETHFAWSEFEGGKDGNVSHFQADSHYPMPAWRK